MPERDRVGENPGRREPGGRSGQRKREREREARPGEDSLRNRASGGRAPEKRERSSGERDGRVGVRQTEENRRRKGEDKRHRGQRVGKDQENISPPQGWADNALLLLGSNFFNRSFCTTKCSRLEVFFSQFI